MFADYSDTRDSQDMRNVFLRECEMIETAVSNSFGVCVEQLRMRSRVRNIVEARMAMFWLWRQFFVITTTQLGALYGRDHATIIYNIRVAEDLKQFDGFFAKRLSMAQQEVELKIDTLEETRLPRRKKKEEGQGVNSLVFWYCADADGHRRLFLEKPQRGDGCWEGRLVSIDDYVLSLLSEPNWDQEPLPVEMTILGEPRSENS